MKKPLVSIIIPTYNSEKTLRHCVESAINQTYKNLEIIIIDDGSTDKTIDEIHKIKDARVSFESIKHAGISAARNLGIDKSTGDYIMFLDSDDMLELDAVAKLINFARKNNIQVLKFAHKLGKYGEFLPKNIPCFREGCLDMSNNKDFAEVADRLFKNEQTVPCFVMTLFLDRDFVVSNKLRFNEKLFMMEDTVFHLDIMKTGTKIFFWKKYLYNMYLNPDSTTRSLKMAKQNFVGVLESSKFVLDALEWDGLAARKYLKIAFEYLAKNKKVSRSTLENNKLRKLAEKSILAKDKIYWKIVRRAILNKNVIIVRLLMKVYYVKNHLGSGV